MSIEVSLRELIDNIETQSDDVFAYLNKQTGEFVIVTSEELESLGDEKPLEDYPDWRQDAIKLAAQIIESDDYLDLPSRYDIHEYSIMENFCLSIEDEQKSQILSNTIQGSGAFRRFKDAIRIYGIEKDWYKYREEAFKEIAIEWCKGNNIKFIDDTEAPKEKSE